MNEFKRWWYAEGSGAAPRKDEDLEEFACRIAEQAWNAAKRNEFICERCLLRQNDTHPKGDF